MSNYGQEPIFSNDDDDIVILDEKDGVKDTTPRPVSEARRKEIQERLAKAAEWRRQMQLTGQKEAEVMRARLKETPRSDIEQRFDAAMLDIYRRAKTEARYNAMRYLEMLADRPGLEAARILLHAHSVSEGYIALWERGRLDLSVEALIHEHPEFHQLFTDEEREITRKRLVEYEYPPLIVTG